MNAKDFVSCTFLSPFNQTVKVCFGVYVINSKQKPFFVHLVIIIYFLNNTRYQHYNGALWQKNMHIAKLVFVKSKIIHVSKTWID